MLAKPLLFAIIAACGMATGAPDTGEDRPYEAPEEPQEAQHWCCQSVDPKTLSGEGCTAISGSLETINACNKVLYCPGAWTKDDGKVICE